MPILSSLELKKLKTILRWIYRILKRRNNQNNVEKYSENEHDSYSLFDSIYHYYEVAAINGIYHVNCADQNVYQSSNQHQIEARHPFFDSRLVEYALSIPEEYKISDSQLKFILKEAMKDLLPEIILKRNDKANFFETTNDEIRAINQDLFWKKPSIVELELLTEEELKNFIKEYRESDALGIVNKPIEEKWDKITKIYKMWGLIGLESWYRYHFNNKQ